MYFIALEFKDSKYINHYLYINTSISKIKLFSQKIMPENQIKINITIF